LKYFDVSKDNANCTSINGVLYDRSQKDRAYLLEAPAAIKEIRITKDVAKIREGAFRYCKSIEKIQVEEGNKRYKCVDGMLCELKDDKTHLMLVPTTVSGEFICPKGINVLDSRCFINLDDITKVVLSEEVERVENYAFGYHPENLKVIDVPSPSTIIDENAIHFFKDYEVWTVQCMEGSEADKTARKMGWNVDNTPYEEKTRKWREEQELIKLEVERKAREEAERKAREEAERKAREEVERKAREEEERKAKEEAERKEREKEKRKAAREEAKRKAREEAEHKAYEEAQRLEQERIRAERRSKKLCQHCGGTFKGVFTKKCSNCGEKKDY
jgi:chemotaxis protein histidine kinase CheA